jgi:hypothetical protein
MAESGRPHLSLFSRIDQIFDEYVEPGLTIDGLDGKWNSCVDLCNFSSRLIAVPGNDGAGDSRRLRIVAAFTKLCDRYNGKLLDDSPFAAEYIKEPAFNNSGLVVIHPPDDLHTNISHGALAPTKVHAS